MTNYDQLRTSFDNILKELDDICKSIDDLTDFEQNYYLNKPKPHETTNNRKKGYNLDYSKTPSYLLNNAIGGGGTRSTIQLPKLLPNYINLPNKFSYKSDNRVYEKYRKQFSFEQDRGVECVENNYPNQNARTFHLAPSSNQIKEELRSNKNYSKKHRLPDDKNSTPMLNSIIGSASVFLSNESNSDNYDGGGGGGGGGGGVGNSCNRGELPVATDEIECNNNYMNRITPSTQIQESKGDLTPRPQIITSDENGNHHEFLGSSISVNAKKFSNDRLENSESEDYLSGSELSKIEYFYSSMGTYVYVGRCIAELYQIKREDEFDSMDTDPVDDYHMFMQNKRKQTDKIRAFTNKKINKLFVNLNNNDHEEGEKNNTSGNESESSDTESAPNKLASVNYMYINSGVPVIVFNYGANPKRNKDLRILLAERSTGFCLWEFKFDRLTQFDNLDEMTVIRLTPNQAASVNPNPNLNPSQFHSFFSSVFPNYASSTSPANITYHNEYFEKFFNSKNRHAHKEHLIKFVIKRDCDDFCFRLMRIMNDKRNSDLFINEYLDNASSISNLNNLRSKNHFRSNQSLNSLNSSSTNQTTKFPQQIQSKSSVIICHFDFFNYEFNHDAQSLGAGLTKKTLSLSNKNTSLSSLSLGKYDQTSLSKVDATVQNFPKSAIKSQSKLTRQYSSSSANIITTSNRPRIGLFRNESLRSNDDIEANVFIKQHKKGFANGEIKHLTGSVINLGGNGSINSYLLGKNGASGETTASRIKNLLVKYKKLKKSEISSPLNFNHVTHLDRPVPIGKRYKIDYC